MINRYEQAKRFSLRILQRTPSTILELLKRKKEPVVITEYGKDTYVMLPYSEKLEIQTEYDSGKIDYETYRQALVNIGHEQLLSGKIKINPGAVVASERTEIEREKTKILGNEFLLEAAKFFGGYLKPHICPRCRIITIPKDIVDKIEEKTVEQLPAPSG